MFAAQLPRRASAYDVYQNRVDQQQGSSPVNRRSSFRIQQDDDLSGGGGVQQKGKNILLYDVYPDVTTRVFFWVLLYHIIIIYFKWPLMSSIVYTGVVDRIPCDYWSYANFADYKPP